MCSVNARWSVKEAFYKAAYPHVVPTWKEVSYKSHNPVLKTKPALEYQPQSTESAEKIGTIHVSVSHDGEYVYSSVLVEGKH